MKYGGTNPDREEEETVYAFTASYSRPDPTSL